MLCTYVKKNIKDFAKIDDVHNINTSNNRNSFMGQCVRFYNKILENLRECSKSQFKRVVKRCLCVNGYYQINDYINDNTPWK